MMLNHAKIASLVLAPLLAAPLFLSGLSVPHSFSDGAVADAAEVNANFAELAQAVSVLQTAVFPPVVYTDNLTAYTGSNKLNISNGMGISFWVSSFSPHEVKLTCKVDGVGVGGELYQITSITTEGGCHDQPSSTPLTISPLIASNSTVDESDLNAVEIGFGPQSLTANTCYLMKLTSPGSEGIFYEPAPGVGTDSFATVGNSTWASGYDIACKVEQ